MSEEASPPDAPATPRPRPRRWLVLAVLAASFVFTLGVLEGGLWFAYRVVLGKPRLLVVDPELGWVHRADFVGTRALGDGSRWKVRIDADGRRDPLFDPPEPAPALVGLGDSFVFGDGVDNEAVFLNRVGRALPARVANLGVVGYSTDQELLALRRFEGRCDIVLLGTYLSNDLSGNLSHSGLIRFKPKFVGTPPDMRLVPVNHPVLNAARHKSYLVTLFLTGLFFVAPELPLFDPPAPDADPWERYLVLADAIVDEAERCGARQLLLLVWTARSEGSAPDAAPELAERYADRPVTVIDLDRLVRERGLDPDELYYPRSVDPGGHWTAEGHAFVADVVLAALNDPPESGRASAEPKARDAARAHE